jgi:uncharacterized protein YjiS (DUF1127 family)
MDRHSNAEALRSSPLELRMLLAELEARALLRVAVLALHLLFTRIATAPGRWHQRAKQRAALENLDDHLLRDIGVDRVQRRSECSKWFWMH